jgi:hypothetical protein
LGRALVKERPGLRPSCAIILIGDNMEKEREEIKKMENGDDSMKITKREKALNYKGIYSPLLVIISVVGFFWVISFSNRIGKYQNDFIYAGIIGFCLLLLLLSFSITYNLQINKNEANSWYKISFINVKRRNIRFDNIRFISIVRLSPSDVYFSGVSFRQYLNLYNKYCIFIIYLDNEYDRVIGFNNYVECKKVANILADKFSITIKDTTQDEFRDEDQYISSYIRYQEMVNEVKKE